jgi:integrase
MKQRLSKQVIDAIKIPDKPVELRDSLQRGLLLRVQPGTGLRTWYFEFRQHGRKTRTKIGRYPDCPVTKARNLAATKRAELVDGKDPAADRRNMRDSLTLRAFVNDHYRPWALLNRKSGHFSCLQITAGFQTILDRKIVSLRMADFTQVRTWRLTHTLERAKAPATHKTINKNFRVLQAAFNWGIEQGLIKSNPILGFKPGVEDRRHHIRAMTLEEERLILDVLADDDMLFRAAFLVSLDTGLRRGELLSLAWEQVDLISQKLTVSGELAKSSQTRSVPLTPRALGALEALQAQYGDTGRVFPMSPGAVYNRWLAVCSDAGVDGVRWHDLRHSFGSRLALAGVPLNVVKNLMGHSNLTVTEKYLHATRADEFAAIEVLSKANEEAIR